MLDMTAIALRATSHPSSASLADAGCIAPSPFRGRHQLELPRHLAPGQKWLPDKIKPTFGCTASGPPRQESGRRGRRHGHGSRQQRDRRRHDMAEGPLIHRRHPVRPHRQRGRLLQDRRTVSWALGEQDRRVLERRQQRAAHKLLATLSNAMDVPRTSFGEATGLWTS